MIELDPPRPRAPRRLLERDIEKRLCERVEACGGTAEKFKSPERASVPDRIVSWPECWEHDCEPCPASVCFVECKRPGEEPTTAQARDHERRRAMGFRVYVVDTYKKVEELLISEGMK